MYYDSPLQHDEINLVRLVRRIEKSVAKEGEWKPRETESAGQVYLKAQKALQNIKFAHSLFKNIEADDYDLSPKRINYLTSLKSKLEHAEAFLKDVEQSSKPQMYKPAPILPTLPLPQSLQPPPIVEDDAQPSPKERSPTPPALAETTDKPSPLIATQGLFISPPDSDEISPTLITSTLPSLLPSNPAETARSSGLSRNFGAVPTARGQTSMAIQEELSSQLELMAKQLKRNAMHFSTSLEKDKAVVEDAQLKLEGNHDVMQKERVRLRDHRGKSRGTTCMVIGIIVLVLVLFMLMASFIRFS